MPTLSLILSLSFSLSLSWTLFLFAALWVNSIFTRGLHCAVVPGLATLVTYADFQRLTLCLVNPPLIFFFDVAARRPSSSIYPRFLFFKRCFLFISP